MALMTDDRFAPSPSPLELVARIATALPSLPADELDALADAVEALTDAIGLQRDWVAVAGGDPTGDGDRRDHGPA